MSQILKLKFHREIKKNKNDDIISCYIGAQLMIIVNENLKFLIQDLKLLND
jgi:hypothetical protein